MPKRFALSAVILVSAICLLLPGGAETAAQAVAPTQSPPDLRVVIVETPPADPDFEALHKRIDEASFENAPFDQCVAWLQTIVDVNLIVRFQTLEDAGVERDKPVTFHGRGLTAAQVLWVLLAEAGGPDLRLGYEAYEDNLLIVSTREDLDRDMSVRVYDVSPLLAAYDAHWKAAELRREQLQAEIRAIRSASYDDTGSRSIFGGPHRQPTTRPSQSHDDSRRLGRTQAEIELLNLLQTTIRPDTWADNGGISTIECFSGLLVVRAPRSIHRELEAFLGSLSEMSAGQ